MFNIYRASEWAVEDFTLSHEVEPEWNIYFTCVDPVGFRTLDRTLRGLPHPAPPSLRLHERQRIDGEAEWKPS